jgi:hypothetical protein
MTNIFASVLGSELAVETSESREVEAGVGRLCRALCRYCAECTLDNLDEMDEVEDDCGGVVSGGMSMIFGNVRAD